jgi:hypothetical protein
MMRLFIVALLAMLSALNVHFLGVEGVKIQLEEDESSVEFGAAMDTFIKRESTTGNLRIHTNNGRSVVIETNGLPRLQVGGGGKVGIGLPVTGVAIPTAALHVAREVGVNAGIAVTNVGTGAGAHASVNIQSQNAAAFVGFTAAAVSNSWSMGASQAGDFHLMSNTNQFNAANIALTVDTDGHLGVGTTLPGRCNHVLSIITLALPLLLNTHWCNHVLSIITLALSLLLNTHFPPFHSFLYLTRSGPSRETQRRQPRRHTCGKRE